MRARTIEVDGSHSIVVSQPARIADLIRSAVDSLTPVQPESIGTRGDRREVALIAAGARGKEGS
jgi:hypothetical protein